MSEGEANDVAVLGAGVAGLVAAYRLGLAGHRCDVYERWPGLGGQAATIDVGDGVLLERYYHHLFTTDRHIADLYEELGVEDAIEWVPSKVGVFSGGRGYRFTTPTDLLRFSPLSLWARFRLGLSILRLQRRSEPGELEGMSAGTWIRENMGEEVWRVLWGPLLRAKFGSRAEQVTMAWLWSKLTLRRRMEGKEARQEMLGYPRDGFEPLFRRLRDEIESRGGRVLIDRPAKEIARDGRFRVTWGKPDSFRTGHDPRDFEAGGSETYDAVVATVPSDVFLALLDPGLRAEIGEAYLERVASIEYHTALCVLLELDREFGRFYWTNVIEDEIPFIGLIEQTNLIPAEVYRGRRFLYVANYVEPGDELLGLSPDEVLARYEPGLRRLNPDFSPEWIKQRWLFKEPAAQPIVDVGYRERMPPLETGVPGLVLANTTQIYPEDRGTNYSVRLGAEAAQTLTG